MFVLATNIGALFSRLFHLLVIAKAELNVLAFGVRRREKDTLNEVDSPGDSFRLKIQL